MKSIIFNQHQVNHALENKEGMFRVVCKFKPIISVTTTASQTETKPEPLTVKIDDTVEEKCRICGVVNTYNRHIVRIKELCGNCFKDLPNILAKAETKPETQSHNPELIRFAKNRIKLLATTAIPNYELPADSFIEDAVKDIIQETEKQLYRNREETKPETQGGDYILISPNFS